MNERIRELAVEAGFTVLRAQGLKESVPPDVFAGDSILINTELEMFAELIVRECIDICYNHPARMPSNNWQGVTVPLDIVHRLEEHFGVEE